MKRPITIISSISIALFLTALIAFGAGLYIDKKNGTQEADARYERLLADTKESFAHAPYGTKEFANSFIRAIGSIDDFSSLKLEVNDSLVYSYPPSTFSFPSPELVKSYKDTVYLSEGNFTLKASIYLMHPSSIYKHSRFAFLLILVGTIIVGIFIVFYNGTTSEPLGGFARRTPNPKFQKRTEKADEQKETETKPAKTEKTEQSEIEAEEETIFADEIPESKAEETEKTENAAPQKAEIQKSEKIPENAVSPKSTKQEENAKSSENAEPHAHEDSSPKADSAESEEITISFPEPKVAESEADEELIEPVFNPEFTQEDEEAWNDDDLFTDNDENTENGDTLDIIDQFEQENKELSDVTDDVFLADSLDSEESSPEPEAEEPFVEPELPSVSPITHLNVESSLEQSLNDAIKNETDLSLALVRINGLDRGNEISQNVISILRASSPAATLFEYKADSYAILLNNMDLQSTVDNFEGIYNKIADFLKDNNAANEVSIGISSVSTRKIQAERIILEASQALDYASQDPDSPIVAFRANPDKYREFEESQA